MFASSVFVKHPGKPAAGHRANVRATGAYRSLIAELFRREPVFAGAALCLLTLMLPTLVAMAVDTRTFQGIDIWIKPLKFEISLTLYLATLAWMAGWLPSGITQKRWYRIYRGWVVACIAAEIVWIGGAAALGTGSHFNVATPMMATIYGLMGFFAVFLTSASAVYGVLILRDGRRAQTAQGAILSPAFRTAAGLGLVLTFGLTVIVAGYMSGAGSHFVGGSGSDAGGLPGLGWARTGGDLRVAHFFATHAMHVLPLLGLVIARVLPDRAGVVAAIGAAMLFGALTIGTFVQALAGKPFI